VGRRHEKGGGHDSHYKIRGGDGGGKSAASGISSETRNANWGVKKAAVGDMSIRRQKAGEEIAKKKKKKKHPFG